MQGNRRTLKDIPQDLNDTNEQADEDRNVHLDDEMEVEEVEGENLDDKYDEDYRRIDALDYYDPADIDDEVNDTEMTNEARRRAEREMNLRDHIEKVGRNPAALYDVESGSIYSDDNDINELTARREQHYQEMGLEDDDGADSEI
jgi:DNA replication licensing factor MCM2